MSLLIRKAALLVKTEILYMTGKYLQGHCPSDYFTEPALTQEKQHCPSYNERYAKYRVKQHENKAQGCNAKSHEFVLIFLCYDLVKISFIHMLCQKSMLTSWRFISSAS